MSTFVALLASGLAEGAVAALAAVGFLITYKATGVVNFAQGALISLGAYVAYWLTSKNGAFGIGSMGLVPGYIVTILLMFLVGMALERLAYAPLRGRSVHVVVIATLGANIVVIAFISLWQGTSPLFLGSPVQGDILHVAGAAITWQRILILLVTAVVITGTILLFQFTQFGRQLRATAADRETARLYGVPVNMLSMFAFGIAAALAALAGILIAPLGNLTTDLGFNYMLLGFAAAVLGGFGSLGGVVVGGIAIGLVEQLLGGYMVQWFGTPGLGDYKSMYPFVLMLVVIALRPQGLFTRGAGERL